MPFVARCQFCPAEFRMPDHAVGNSILCPRCNNHFTVVPLEGPPKKKPPRPRGSGAEPKPKAKSGSPCEKDAVLAGTSTGWTYEPPELPPEEAPPHPEAFDPPEPAWPAAAPAPAFREPRRGGRPSLGGVVALLLAGLALCTAFIPAVNVMTVPLALVSVALLAGVLLLRIWAWRDLALLLPAGGLSLTVVAVALFQPEFFGRDWARPPAELFHPRQRLMVPHDGSAAQPYPATEWLDVIRADVQEGDVQLRVVEVGVAVVERKPAQHAKPEKVTLLLIRTRLTNIAPERRLRYEAWATVHPAGDARLPVLKDEAGRFYPLRDGNFEPDADREGKVFWLEPGSTVEEVLCFAPPAGTQALLLELPAGNVDLPGSFRLRIPNPTDTRP